MLPEKLYGINTLSSLLEINSGKRKIYKILVNSQKKDSHRITEIIKKAAAKKIPVKINEPEVFSNLFIKNFDFKPHEEDIKNTQGIIAEVSPYNYPVLEDDISSISTCIRGDGPANRVVLALLDGITDAGNFGAILRSCSAFGINGVVIPSNRSADVSHKVSRISSGALEEIKVYKVTNLVRTINYLKDNGFWVYGTTLLSDKKVIPAGQADYSFPAAVVFGSEEKGVGNLIESKCDILIKIEQYGRMQSLNVAVSAGIMFYVLKNFQKAKEK